MIDEQLTRDAVVEPASTALLHVIINPAAGGGRAGRRWPDFEAEMSRHGYDIRPSFTSGPGDATSLARQLAHDGARTIVCVGGDGTANEVVNGLFDGERAINPGTRLALLPCGTGKDLGRTLGTRDVESMLRALADGTTALMDVGRVTYRDVRTGELTSRYFANVADAGIGAETAARINRSSKALGGFVSYLSGAVRSIAGYQPWDVTVEVDGVPIHTGLAGMVVFANGRYFAGGMKVAPEASICDGLLDIFVLEGVGKRTLLTSLLPRVYRGKHTGQPGVIHLTGRQATVGCVAGMLLELDGEQVGRTPVTVDVLPGALRVVGTLAALAEAGGCAEHAG
ncbi:MAG: diacylglycerol kinase family lipid kinase [Chloroflexota bacterium]|nr:diacylglycerol kinase family lipid kinase [Chloroflexota bacterium]